MNEQEILDLIDKVAERLAFTSHIADLIGDKAGKDASIGGISALSIVITAINTKTTAEKLPDELIGKAMMNGIIRIQQQRQTDENRNV